MYKMYNKKRKNAFIDWYQGITRPYYFESLFSKTNFYEKHYQKDVSDFLHGQILEFLKSLSAPSINSLQITASMLRAYTDWCLNNNMSIDGQNHYNEIKVQDLTNCVSRIIFQKKIFTREQIVAYAESLNNDCDKFMLLAVYEGLRGSNFCELLNLEGRDLKYTNLEFCLYTGRTIKVSKRLMRYAYNAANEFDYYSTTDDNFFVAKLKRDSDLVFKPRANITSDTTESKYARLLGRMAKLKVELDAPELTLPRLFNSGVVNSIREEAERLNISSLELLDRQEVEKIKKQYNLKYSTYGLRNRYREYLE